MLSNHNSSAAPQTAQIASPVCGTKNFLQCVCTRRRNCIEQLSPSPKYAPGTARFPARNSAIIKLIWLILDPGVIRSSSLASQCNRSLPQRNHADRQRLPRRDGSAPPVKPLKGAGPIGRPCGGHIFVNRPFGHRDAIGVSNSNQSSQVAGAFFKICHPQICAPSRAFSSPELRHSQTADYPKVSIEGVMPANPDG